jgi:hypothetical protein
MNDTRMTMTHRNTELDALVARYALRVTARLSEAELTPPDVAERLRFAREQALGRARELRAVVARPQATAVGVGAGVIALSGGPRPSTPKWARFGWILPLLALVAGLVVIQYQQVGAQVAAAAEIDFDLLKDELPPAAYSDPGFLEFLKTPRD